MQFVNTVVEKQYSGRVESELDLRILKDWFLTDPISQEVRATIWVGIGPQESDQDGWMRTGASADDIFMFWEKDGQQKKTAMIEVDEVEGLPCLYITAYLFGGPQDGYMPIHDSVILVDIYTETPYTVMFSAYVESCFLLERVLEQPDANRVRDWLMQAENHLTKGTLSALEENVDINCAKRLYRNRGLFSLMITKWEQASEEFDALVASALEDFQVAAIPHFEKSWPIFFLILKYVYYRMVEA